MKEDASLADSNIPNLGEPGILKSRNNSLAYDLSHSNLAASFVGEAHVIPAAIRASVMPAAKTASGEGKASEMECETANAATCCAECMSPIASAPPDFFTSAAIPGLAADMNAKSFTLASRQMRSAIACSRAPLPTRRKESIGPMQIYCSQGL